MYTRTLLILGLGAAFLLPALAGDNGPQTTNPNVQRAMKNAKKVRPGKYKAPKLKKPKKPARAVYGVH